MTTIREGAGIALIVVALVLTPVAWAFSRLLWLVAFLLLILGGILFFTERMHRRLAVQESASGSSCSGAASASQAMPSDIHDYTGWGSGGHSDTMDSSGDGGGGDA